MVYAFRKESSLWSIVECTNRPFESASMALGPLSRGRHQGVGHDNTWEEFDTAGSGVILQELYASGIGISLSWGQQTV
jgi:hypothetical protein